jgi:phage terminase small subunit
MAVYDLAPAETVMLGQACRVVDLLARADAELAAADLTVRGSTGQPKANPLIAASSDLRRVLDALIRSLALPMPDEMTGRRRSPSAVAAAQARWRGERGGLA